MIVLIIVLFLFAAFGVICIITAIAVAVENKKKEISASAKSDESTDQHWLDYIFNIPPDQWEHEFIALYTGKEVDIPCSAGKYTLTLGDTIITMHRLNAKEGNYQRCILLSFDGNGERYGFGMNEDEDKFEKLDKHIKTVINQNTSMDKFQRILS